MQQYLVCCPSAVTTPAHRYSMDYIRLRTVAAGKAFHAGFSNCHVALVPQLSLQVVFWWSGGRLTLSVFHVAGAIHQSDLTSHASLCKCHFMLMGRQHNAPCRKMRKMSAFLERSGVVVLYLPAQNPVSSGRPPPTHAPLTARKPPPSITVAQCIVAVAT